MEQDNLVGCKCEKEWEIPSRGKGLMVQGGGYKEWEKMGCFKTQ